MNPNPIGVNYIKPTRPPSSISNNSSMIQSQPVTRRITFRDAPRSFTITSSIANSDQNRLTTIDKNQLDRILSEKNQLWDQNNNFRNRMTEYQSKLNKIRSDHQQQVNQLRNTYLVETRQLNLIYSTDRQVWKQQLEKLKTTLRFNHQKQIKRIRQQYEQIIQQQNQKFIQSKNHQLSQFDRLNDLQNHRITKLQTSYTEKLQEQKQQHSRQIHYLKQNHQKQFDFRIDQCHTQIRNLNIIIQKISEQKAQLKNQISSKQLKSQLELERQGQKRKQMLEQRQRKLRLQYNAQCIRLQEIIRIKQLQTANMAQQLKQLENQLMLVNSQNQVVENDQQKLKKLLIQKQLYINQLVTKSQYIRKDFEKQIYQMKKKYNDQLRERINNEAQQGRQVQEYLQRQNQRLKREHTKQVEFLNQELRKQRAQLIELKNKMIHSFQLQKQAIIRDYQREIQRERSKNQFLSTDSRAKYESAVGDFTAQINKMQTKHNKNIKQIKQQHDQYIRKLRQEHQYQSKKLMQQADRVRNRQQNYVQIQRELKMMKQRNIQLINQLKNGQKQCQKHQRIIEEQKRKNKQTQNQVQIKEDLLNQLKGKITAIQKERRLQMQQKNNEIDLLEIKIANLSKSLNNQEEVQKALITKQQSQNALDQAQRRYFLEKKCLQEKIKLLNQALRKKQQQFNSERENHNSQIKQFFGKKSFRTQISQQMPILKQKSSTGQKQKLQMIIRQQKNQISQNKIQIQGLRSTNKKLRQQMLDNISNFDKEKAYNEQLKLLKAKLKGYQQRFRIQSLSKQERIERIKKRSESKDHTHSRMSSESGQKIQRYSSLTRRQNHLTNQPQIQLLSNQNNQQKYKIRLQTVSNQSKQEETGQLSLKLKTQTIESGFKPIGVPKFAWKNSSTRQQRTTNNNSYASQRNANN